MRRLDETKVIGSCQDLCVKSYLRCTFFWATTKVMKPSGSDEKDGGGWWGDLPDWLMRREKPHIAASLGRCGARYTSSIICAPPSVVPGTARLLTTRMSIAQPIRQGPSARLGVGAESWVTGNWLKKFFGNKSTAKCHFYLPFGKTCLCMYLYPTKLRIFSICFSRIRPRAIANMTHRAKPHRSFILAIPRIVCSSKPNDTSSRLLTRSTAVR
jgi:hypothetical protein